MRKTTNYNLSLYDSTDKMSITASENSLNANMELIDDALKELDTKASTKPTYTASEVGADASGTASSAVSAHNTSTSAHFDIRKHLGQLSSEIATVKNQIASGVTYTNVLPTAINADGTEYVGDNGKMVTKSATAFQHLLEQKYKIVDTVAQAL